MSTLSQFFLSSAPTVANNTPDGRKSIEGGWYISRGPVGTAWIVASLNTEVSRNWYCREDAVTKANACTGCTGWFVPTRTQLQNPGYTCRTYWDSFSSTVYWSSTEAGAPTACDVDFATGLATSSPKALTNCVRAFRCVTY